MLSSPHLPPSQPAPGALLRALAVIADPWKLQVVKEAYLGTRRFDDFRSRLGIPRQTLNSRLNELTDKAVFYKRPVQRQRLFYEYRLTPKGADLSDFILMTWRWHRRWHLDESTLPARLYHRVCGESFVPRIRCASCRRDIVVADVELRRGPGQSHRPPPAGRRARIVNELQQKGVNYLATVVLGDYWSILVLHAVMQNLRHFGDIERALGISSNVLSQRLRTLTSLDLLEAGQPPDDGRKSSYSLTRKGLDVYPMILALMEWGDRWLAGAGGPTEVRCHSACGEVLHGEVYCSRCDGVVNFGDIDREPLA